MAPERFEGRSDPRSDVYSLGTSLYELVTLHPAFEASDRLKLIEQVRRQTPPTPRNLDRRIPRDLETIVQKAMAREPGDRYASAEALWRTTCDSIWRIDPSWRGGPARWSVPGGGRSGIRSQRC
jgi:serine/threonine protein kinase